MRCTLTTQRVLCLATVLAFLLLTLPVPGTTAADGNDPYPDVQSGTQQFDDTLWAGVNTVYSASPDAQTGEIWYATAAGVVLISPDAKTRTLISPERGLLPGNSIQIALTPTDAWVGGDQGVSRIDRKTLQVVQTFRDEGQPNRPPANLTQVVRVEGDMLWTGTYKGGVGRYNITTGTWLPAIPTYDGVHKPVKGTPNWPVKDILLRKTDVWILTEGGGIFVYDRLTGNTRVIMKTDGLHSNYVFAATEQNGIIWMAIDGGLQKYDPSAPYPWTFWNRTQGMSHAQARAIIARGEEIWVGTQRAVTIYNTHTQMFTYFSRGSGLLSNFVQGLAQTKDEVFFATDRGLTVWHEPSTKMRHYRTGNGLISPFVLSSSTQDSGPWFGTLLGVTRYDQSTNRLESLGWYDGLDGEYIYQIVPDPKPEKGWDMWFPTAKGVFGWSNERQQWLVVRDPDYHATNVFFGMDVDPDGDTLWLPEWGFGLIKASKSNTTNWFRYNFVNSCVTALSMRDAKVVDNNVWIATLDGLQRFGKAAEGRDCDPPIPASVNNALGFPSDNLTRLEVDGKDLWVYSLDGGLVKFNTITRQVFERYNKNDGIVINGAKLSTFPTSDVRDVHKDGADLWIATDSGLLRWNLASRKLDHWTTAHGLLANFTTTVTVHNGIVYVGTLNGVARYDTVLEKFLPVQVGEGARNAPDAGTGLRRFLPNVRIVAPSEGEAVNGVIDITGTASSPSGVIDRIEVRVDDGNWTQATGQESWNFKWDTTNVTAGRHTIFARAVAGGNFSKEAVLHLTVVPPSKVPLTVRVTPRDTALQNRPLTLQAVASGDEPLNATLHYRLGQSGPYQIMPMARGGNLFRAEIPADRVNGPILQYYVVASSGLLKKSDPADVSDPYNVTLLPPPRAAATLDVASHVTARAGLSTPVKIEITNTGTSEADYTLRVRGARAHWVKITSPSFTVQPGETVERTATVTVPAEAYADNTTLRFVLQPVTDVEPVEASTLLTTLAKTPTDVGSTPTPSVKPPKGVIPVPGGAWAFAVLALAALLGTRRARGGRRS